MFSSADSAMDCVVLFIQQKGMAHIHDHPRFSLMTTIRSGIIAFSPRADTVEHRIAFEKELCWPQNLAWQAPIVTHISNHIHTSSSLGKM